MSKQTSGMSVAVKDNQVVLSLDGLGVEAWMPPEQAVEIAVALKNAAQTITQGQ